MVPELSNVILVLAIVFANFVFVAAEFALVRSRLTRLKGPEYRKKLGVGYALKLLEDLDRTLSDTQLGITIASLLLGWWGEHTFQRIFYSAFAYLGETAASIASHGAATILALVLVTFLHVVLGELVAKSIAIRHPEFTLRITAAPILVFSVICRPVSAVLQSCAGVFLKILGVSAALESERAHSSAELAILVSESTQRGVLDKDEEQMLHGVFTFSDTVAREVMTPRTDLVALAADSKFEEVVAAVSKSRFSRFPVYGDTIDNILGILLIRDLFAFVQGHSASQPKEFDVRKIMREPYFIPGTKRIDDLLNEFKRRKVHMAIVVDEHGGVDGLVTLEDLIEEIVGEIFDESDIPQKEIVVQESGEVLVDGGVLVSDLNSRFEFAIPEGDYDTIAGFIYTTLGGVPRPGDKLLVRDDGVAQVSTAEAKSIQDLVDKEKVQTSDLAEEEEEVIKSKAPLARSLLTVERMKGRRIETVRIQSLFRHKTVETRSDLSTSEPKIAVSGQES